MLVKFKDDDLRHLYEDLEFRVPQIGPVLTKRFRKLVGFVVQALDERDLYAMASLHYEKLEGDRAGQRSLRLDQKWRLIVTVETIEELKTIIVIEMVDYH